MIKVIIQLFFLIIFVGIANGQTIYRHSFLFPPGRPLWQLSDSTENARKSRGIELLNCDILLYSMVTNLIKYNHVDKVIDGDCEAALPQLDGVSLTNINATSAQSTEQKWDYNYSAKVTFSGSGSQSFGTYYASSSSSEPGSVQWGYYISVHVYKPAAIGDLYLRNKQNGVITTLDSVMNSDDSWDELTGYIEPQHAAGDYYVYLETDIDNHSGHYFYFDDLTVFREIGEIFENGLTQQGTISCWYRPYTDNNNVIIWERRDIANQSINRNGLFKEEDEIRFSWYSNYQTGTNNFNMREEINYNDWNHLTVTFFSNAAVNDTAKLYINKDSVQIETVPNRIFISDFRDSLHLAANSSLSYNSLQGVISGLIIDDAVFFDSTANAIDYGYPFWKSIEYLYDPYCLNDIVYYNTDSYIIDEHTRFCLETQQPTYLSNGVPDGYYLQWTKELLEDAGSDSIKILKDSSGIFIGQRLLIGVPLNIDTKDSWSNWYNVVEISSFTQSTTNDTLTLKFVENLSAYQQGNYTTANGAFITNNLWYDGHNEFCNTSVYLESASADAYKDHNAKKGNSQRIQVITTGANESVYIDSLILESNENYYISFDYEQSSGGSGELKIRNTNGWGTIFRDTLDYAKKWYSGSFEVIDSSRYRIQLNILEGDGDTLYVDNGFLCHQLIDNSGFEDSLVAFIGLDSLGQGWEGVGTPDSLSYVYNTNNRCGTYSQYIGKDGDNVYAGNNSCQMNVVNGGYCYIGQTVSLTTSTTYTLSFYAKGTNLNIWIQDQTTSDYWNDNTSAWQASDYNNEIVLTSSYVQYTVDFTTQSTGNHIIRLKRRISSGWYENYIDNVTLSPGSALSNGDFETLGVGGDDIWADWDEYHGTSSLDNEITIEGIQQDSISLSKYQWYTSKFKIKAIIDSSLISIRLMNYNSGWQDNQLLKLYADTTWQEYAFTFYTSGYNLWNFKLTTNDSTAYLLDDVVLFPLSKVKILNSDNANQVYRSPYMPIIE